MYELTDIVQKVLLAIRTDGGAVRHPTLDSGDKSMSLESVATTAVIKKLEKELDSSREEMNRYKSELESSSESFKVVIALKNNKLQQLEKELESSREEMKGWKNVMNENDRQIIRLELALEWSKMELTECKEEVATKSDLIATKRLKIGVLQMDSESIKGELELCKEEVKRKSDTIKIKDEKIAELAKSLGAVQKITTPMGSIDQCHKETIRATFTGISRLTSEDCFSGSMGSAGSFWAISISRHYEGRKKYLSVDLWIVPPYNQLIPSNMVYYRMNLFSHNGSKPAHSTQWDTSRYDRNATAWGSTTFISFEDLFKSSNEFVKKDSIMIAIDFIPFPGF
ncbi:hypothetical protein PFISCL1PPCAC_20311 [Pristionchus fissidentatus]|uniref:MATH domain-containing protein n=1 Tax=Pristionchus fissidentatus TaxID=1538716 RepID=A0AAV5WAJ6_9BILA|nr:hypothetical protein PFISCL1PPCAC_20311 [Pristionchus fissidentatus]